MVWYSHLFQNFPQFIVIHIVKGFCIVNKAEVDVFLELSCFFHDPANVGNLISGSSAFSKTSLDIWKFTVHILLKHFGHLMRRVDSLVKTLSDAGRDWGQEAKGTTEDEMARWHRRLNGHAFG